MNKKTLKEIKFFLIVLALLIIADLLFLFYYFHVPHRQDALSVLIIFIIPAASINVIIGTLLLCFRKTGAGIAFCINSLLIPIGIFKASSYSHMNALRNEFSSYVIKTADTTFHLTLYKDEEKSFSLLYTFPGGSSNYVDGFYRKTSDSTFILDVDTTTYMRNKHLRQFTVTADTIKGLREKPLVMERRI